MAGAAKIGKIKKPQDTRARARTSYKTGGRFGLADVEKAKQSARGQVSARKQKKTTGRYPDATRGESLKSGVDAMADKISDSLTEEQYQKLKAMDPDRLDALYETSDMVFEVYFNYGSFTEDPTGATVATEANAANAQFLIDQYERVYGRITIGRQMTL